MHTPRKHEMETFGKPLHRYMNRRLLLKSLTLSALAPSVLAKSPSPNFVRLAHITDVHILPFFTAMKGFERCLHHIQSLDVKPSLIINGGDSVMEAHLNNANAAERQWKAWHRVLASENQLPMLHTIGNHDIWCPDNSPQSFETGKKMAADQLQMSKNYYSTSLGAWKIIVLDSVQCGGKERWYTARLDDAQMDWLKKELKNTPANQFVAVVSHVPILAACVFFDGKRLDNGTWQVPGAWMHADSREITELFYQYPNVKLALSGHVHLRDLVEYNGVTYCCNGAVSGAWWAGKYQHTAPGYATIDLFDDGTFSNQYAQY